MSRQLFGTDGIRGPAGTYPLDDVGMRQIGKSVGAYFTKPGDVVLVGWDPRESSEMLVKGVVDGLVAMGVDVRKAGVIPTPGLAYLTKHQNAVAGVMITASHNPYTDNGVKVFTSEGRKLPDEAQTALNELIARDIAGLQSGKSIEEPSLIRIYEDFLIACAKGASLDGLNIGVDSANGATSGIAEEVFSKLGAKVVPLFDKPDGRNINVQCGATDTAALQDTVLKQGLGAGVAFDGDGDRVMMVDEKGRQLTGDHLLYILAVAGKQKGVVATLMSNQGLETALKKHNIAFRRTAVGDRSVIEGLEQTGFQLGGEQSGHIILPQYFNTGDGLLAAIRTLVLAIASGKTLGVWYDELELLPQTIISIPFPDKSLLERSDIQTYIAEQTEQLGDGGRINIRASGTEPKVRVMVEAQDAEERARAVAAQLIELTSSKL